MRDVVHRVRDRHVPQPEGARVGDQEPDDRVDPRREYGRPGDRVGGHQVVPPSIETDASIASDVVQAGARRGDGIEEAPRVIATAVNACVPGSATELAECVTDSPGFSGAGSVGPSPVSESITTTLPRNLPAVRDGDPVERIADPGVSDRKDVQVMPCRVQVGSQTASAEISISTESPGAAAAVPASSAARRLSPRPSRAPAHICVSWSILHAGPSSAGSRRQDVSLRDRCVARGVKVASHSIVFRIYSAS